MSVSSSALIRFQIYDKCLKSKRRNYTREDIRNELKKTESRERKKSRGGEARKGIEVNDRQFYKDLKTIEEVWGIEIERRLSESNKKVYSYKHPDFSIFSTLPKDNDLIELRDSLFVLKQFRGLPHFSFLRELQEKIEGKETGDDKQNIVVEFDKNLNLKGLEHFPFLLNAIQQKKSLKIRYNKSYKNSKHFIISPYFLKEYGNRWFLFGTEKGYNSISNIALDRIEQLDYATDEPYQASDVDFSNDYFENIIGVTIPKNAEILNVVLRFSESRFPFVESKPLHWSQKTNKDEKIVKIRVCQNQELESLILHYGSDVEVLQPESLRISISNKISKMFDLYADRK